jgi:transposase
MHIICVGLDVHNDTIAVALADGGQRGEVREYGKIANTPAALKTLCAKLARNGANLRFCYEAGPCGYGNQRRLSGAGHECVVVAPSLIPRKPGDRIKTDRRDAGGLAKLHRAGEFTSVWVPDPPHKAIRDLVRARLAEVRAVRQARQQLPAACYVMATIITGRHGALAGRSTPHITSCWKIVSRLSRWRGLGGAVWVQAV